MHYLQPHHNSQYIFIPKYGGNYFYSNMGLSAYETVDFQLVASMIQNQMGASTMQASLLSGGTLGSLMAGMSTIGTVPSLMELLICIALVGIEAGVTSPLMQASKTNRKYLYTTLASQDVTKRLKEISPIEQIDRNEKGVLRTLIPITLLALYIFKKALPDHDIEQESYLDLQNKCFNVAHMIGIPQLSGGGDHIRSYMQSICSVMLGIYNCSRGWGGQGSTICYYQHYANVYDSNIHNAFFKQRLPQKNRTVGAPNNMNSFVSYFARMLFCNSYSPFELHVEIASLQRSLAYSSENLSKDTGKVMFDKYLFKPIDGVYTNEKDSLLNEISFDSIQEMIINIGLPTTVKNMTMQTKFDNLLQFAENYAIGYSKIMNLLKGRKCTFAEDPIDSKKANEFQEDMPEYPTDFYVNKSIISDVQYSYVKVLTYREDTSLAKEQKKLYITSIGNNITLGFIHVGQFKYNWNPVTFDIYVKVRGQGQIIENVDSIINTINQYPYKNISSLTGSLDKLEKIFDGKSETGTDEEQLEDQLMIQKLKPLIDFTQDIGQSVEAMRIRSVYKKDIFDNDI